MKAHDYYANKELIHLIQQLIRIPSHVHAPGREKEVARFIQSYFQEAGIEAELQPVDEERFNVMAFLKGSKESNGRSLLLNGHTDTVPPDKTRQGPKEGSMEDGCIWGRGAVDMKGPLAAMIMAMVVIKRSGIQWPGSLVFAGVTGEETNSDGMESLACCESCISGHGIQLDGAVVGEPTNFKYVASHRGLVWLDIHIKGKGAHSGKAHRGVNAIEKAVDFLARVKGELHPKLKERYHEHMGTSLMNIGTIEGGTGQSTVAEEALIRLDRRYISGETMESVIQEYQEIIDAMKQEDPDFQAEITRTPESVSLLPHPPLETKPGEPIIVATHEALTDLLGREPELKTEYGWTDGALISKYMKIPTVVCGPGDISLAHTSQERISLEDLMKGVEFYANLAETFCQGKEAE